MRLLFLFGSLLGANGLYADDNPSFQLSREPLTASTMVAQGSWDYRVDGAGRLWLAYYDENRLLRLRDPDGEERLLAPAERAQAPSGLALAALETGVGLLWRDKLPTKGLFLLDTTRPEMQPLEVGGDTEPLARFSAEAGADGLLHLLWYGEKRGEPTGEQHNLYYRQFNRRTNALSPIELVMAGIYPLMSTDDSGNLMVYSWLTQEGKQQIVARYRPANASADTTAEGFGDAVAIAETPAITPIFDAFRSGSRWFVLWLSQYGSDKRDFLLEGAHSNDDGKTWKHFAFEDLRGIDIASLQVASDAEGHILLVFTGRSRKDDAKTKQDIYLIRSDDRGDTWSTAKRLRHQDGQPSEGQTEGLSAFHARNPSVAFGQVPGEVLVVWEDWRDIRSGLYASLSKDYGQTWTLSNIPLSHPAVTNLGLRYEPSSLSAANGGFKIIGEQLTDDSLKTKKLVQLQITADALARYAESLRSIKGPDAEAREATVRKRAEGFWQAMLAKDYTKTYDYQDPFFRARMPLQFYLSELMGKIEYSHAEVEGIRLDGPRAEVKTKIRASVPAFRVPSTGETISQPEREATVISTWLWLDGDWYREFRIESRDIVFTRY